jgi:Xaa-Pro dipeptidase
VVSATDRALEIRDALSSYYPRFSDAEYQRRYQNIRDLMDRMDLQCLLIYGDSGHCYMNTANVRYVANYADHQYSYVVFPRTADLTLFISIPNLLPGALAISAVQDVRWALGSRRDMATQVSQRVKETGAGQRRIGIVGPDSVRMPSIPHHHYETLRERLPDAELIFISREFEALRAVQSPEEIEWLQKGAEFTDRAMEAMAEAVKPGVREYELYAAQHCAYLPLGGHLMFSIMSSTSMHEPRSPHPAAWASERPLVEGDIIMTEISGAYWGYAGQIIRAIALGEPTQQYRDLYNLTVEVHDRVREVLKPGCGEKDVLREAARITDAGYISLTPIIHGWGLGLSPPYVGTQGSEAWWSEGVTFQEDQTIMIEPNATTPDLTCGIVVGTLHRVTPDGGVPYQKYPMEFIVKQ